MNLIGQGPLVLGTAQLGLDYGVANTGGMPTDAAAAEILATAAQLGVTHVDTARTYGISEQRIGNLWRPPAGVITKVRPLDLPEDCSADEAIACVDDSVRRSLAALRRDSIDALLLHWCHERHAGGGAVARRLAELVAEGVCRVAGVSLSDPAELVQVLDEDWCGYVQLPFNLLDRRWLAEDVQQALADRPEVIITVRSVYLQGLLATDHPWPQATGLSPAQGVRLRGLLAELAADCGLGSPAELAVAYVLSQPWVTSAVVGAESADQLRQTARHAARRLTADQLASIRAALPPVPTSLLTPGAWTDPSRQGRRESA